MKPCANPACGQLHTNSVYCSYACRNTGEWRKHVQTSLARARQMRRVQFTQQIHRMIARCKVLGQTEDERLILAWRYGLGASKQRRFRAKADADRIRRCGVPSAPREIE